MKYFWILFFVLFFATNSLDKAESVQLEELENLPLQTFDELFVDEWWDKDEADDLKTPAPTNFGQNVHHQIYRQNTQIGQIEPNSTDQLGQIEPNSTDQLGQIGPNSTDQNPPLTESDHSGQIEPNRPPLTESDHSGQIEPNSTDQNPPLTESDHSDNAKNGEEQNKITSNENIAEDERKHKTVAKKLGLNFTTIYKWKRELSQITSNKYPQGDQKDLMKRYYEIKDKNPKMNVGDIAKMLKIGKTTLFRWKKQFKRHAASVQEIGNTNSGSI
uniref:Transposase n=1 Tax=Globodera rostochiensis TaxID=31243 RepID=A0A914HU52_GLORO